MMCAWNEFLSILPSWLRQPVDEQGSRELQELRLRVNAPPELVMKNKIHFLARKVEPEDIRFCVNAASRYSPWAAATAAQGYITAPGGHRIGLCGDTVYKDGEITGIRDIRSICIRIARDFPGIAGAFAHLKGSILILGAPGWGKTTLLRDLIRQIAEREVVAVVDERAELFPEGFLRGKRMDVLTGCPKSQGTDMLLRTMGPSCIAADEITAKEDAEALLHAAGCGVRLITTCHASSRADLHRRIVYKPLVENAVFDHLILLHADKSSTAERMIL